MSALGLVVAVQLLATPITLEEVRAAAKQNLDALRAELDVDRAASGRTQTKSSIYPHLNLSAGASDFVAGPQRTFTTVPTPLSDGTIGFRQESVDTPGFSRGNFSLNLSLSQLLYDGGKWWNQIAQAGEQAEAAFGQLDEQRLASELEAVRRFYELVRAQLTLQVLDASVERSRTQVERATSLYEAGRGKKSDVLDAEVNLGNDRIAVMRQSQGIQGAQVDLLKWLGRPGDDVTAVPPEVLDPKLRAASGPPLEQALSTARSKRPLLRALGAQVRSAELGVDLARSSYFPVVTAQAAYQRSSPTADPFFTDLSRQNALIVGANLSWDFFSGFLTDGQVSRARADLTQNELQQKQAVVDLEGELRRGLKTLETQVAIADVAEANRALAEQQLNIEEERYSAGAGSTLEVRNAQVKVTQAQLTQVQGRIDVEIARAAVQRTIGAAVEGTP